MKANCSHKSCKIEIDSDLPETYAVINLQANGLFTKKILILCPEHAIDFERMATNPGKKTLDMNDYTTYGVGGSSIVEIN